MGQMELSGIKVMSCGILTHDERAEVLNVITKALDEANFNLEIGGYDDTDGATFDVLFIKKDAKKGLHA